MPAAKVYLIPIDFSKNSQVALTHALKLARAAKVKLLLVHVMVDSDVPVPLRRSYEQIVEKGARAELEKLVRRNKLEPGEYRVILLKGANVAQLLARQAKKARATMIIMSSHGRTGLKHMLLGSVAEKTLRYAPCPVLIVKK